MFCSFYSILGDARWTFGKNWKTFKGTSHWTKHFNRYDQITKLCGNWAFPKTFYTRKLGEISIFYTMTVTIVAYTLGQDPFVLMWSTKRGPLYMVCRNFEYFFCSVHLFHFICEKIKFNFVLMVRFGQEVLKCLTIWWNNRRLVFNRFVELAQRVHLSAA